MSGAVSCIDERFVPQQPQHIVKDLLFHRQAAARTIFNSTGSFGMPSDLLESFIRIHFKKRQQRRAYAACDAICSMTRWSGVASYRGGAVQVLKPEENGTATRREMPNTFTAVWDPLPKVSRVISWMFSGIFYFILFFNINWSYLRWLYFYLSLFFWPDSLLKWRVPIRSGVLNDHRWHKIVYFYGIFYVKEEKYEGFIKLRLGLARGRGGDHVEAAHNKAREWLDHRRLRTQCDIIQCVDLGWIRFLHQNRIHLTRGSYVPSLKRIVYSLFVLVLICINSVAFLICR